MLAAAVGAFDDGNRGIWAAVAQKQLLCLHDVLGTAAAFWIIQGCYKIGAGRCVQAAGDDGPMGEEV